MAAPYSCAILHARALLVIKEYIIFSWKSRGFFVHFHVTLHGAGETGGEELEEKTGDPLARQFLSGFPHGAGACCAHMKTAAPVSRNCRMYLLHSI